jgi:hypothetical protein
VFREDLDGGTGALVVVPGAAPAVLQFRPAQQVRYGRFVVRVDRAPLGGGETVPVPRRARRALRGLPGEGGDDTAALRGEIFQSSGVQGVVGLAQRTPQFQELPAFLRLGAQQEVGCPGCEGGAAGGMDATGIVHPAGCFAAAASVSRRATNSDSGVV